MTHKSVVSRIEKQFQMVLSHPSLSGFLAKEKHASGDFLCVNNTFVFRDVPTKKHALVPGARISNTKPLETADLSAIAGHFNTDFDVVLGRNPKLKPRAIADAVAQEIADFGKMTFVLLGEIDDHVLCREPIGSSVLKELVWDPHAKAPLGLDGDVVTISSTADPDGLRTELEKHAKKAGLIADSLPDALKKAFSVALETLSENARVFLQLPSGKVPADGLLRKLAARIEEIADEYQGHLKKCGGAPSGDTGAYHEMLRLAYNFSADAAELLRLTTSICDLKPLCLWLTVGDQLALSDAFHKLPWMRQDKKPSLKEYAAIISGARNAAFHHLLPVDHTIDVRVDGLSVTAKRLTIFGGYGKNHNAFEYDEQPIVEALLRFTRADQQSAPPAFWQQNLIVMRATATFLKSFDEGLRLIHAAVHSKKPAHASATSGG